MYQFKIHGRGEHDKKNPKQQGKNITVLFLWKDIAF